MPRRKKDRAPAPAADIAWFRERAREVGFSSLADVSLKICGHKDLISRSLGDGKTTPRDLRPRELAELAQALRVPLVILFYRLGYKAPFARTRLAGTVNARGQIEFYPEDAPPRNAPAPSEIDLDLTAVTASPAAGLPYGGATFYFAMPTRIEVGAFSRLAIAALAGDGMFIGTLTRSEEGGPYAELEPIGAKAKPARVELKAAAPVLWVNFG